MTDSWSTRAEAAAMLTDAEQAWDECAEEDRCEIHGATDGGFCEGCSYDNEMAERDSAWMLDSSEGDR